jgi:hypothetical protein
MKLPRFQTDLRRALVAVLWLAVLSAVWTTDAGRFKDSGWEGALFGIYLLRVGAIFPAVGALYGRAVFGAGIGVAVFAALILLVMLLLFSLRFTGGAWSF